VNGGSVLNPPVPLSAALASAKACTFLKCRAAEAPSSCLPPSPTFGPEDGIELSLHRFDPTCPMPSDLVFDSFISSMFSKVFVPLLHVVKLQPFLGFDFQENTSLFFNNIHSRCGSGLRFLIFRFSEWITDRDTPPFRAGTSRPFSAFTPYVYDSLPPFFFTLVCLRFGLLSLAYLTFFFASDVQPFVC